MSLKQTLPISTLIKGELLWFSVFSDLQRILQRWTAKQPHIMRYAFEREAVSVGSALCVLQIFLFLYFFSETLMCAELPYMGMPVLCTKCCVCPLPRSAQTLLHSALCYMDYCQHFVRDGSNKVFFQVNDGQLNLLNFPKEASTRQKLRSFLLPMDSLCVDLFISSTSMWAGLMAKLLLKDRTLLRPVEKGEAQAISNISSVSLLCLFCVSKGVVSTTAWRGACEAKGEE